MGHVLLISGVVPAFKRLLFLIPSFVLHSDCTHHYKAALGRRKPLAVRIDIYINWRKPYASCIIFFSRRVATCW
jgi:hypothetical protein